MARAPRFPLHLPMRYRESGMVRWYEGKTLDISRTGVLFLSDHDLQVRSVLEIQIDFPAIIAGKSVPATVGGWGPVVRRQSLEFPADCQAYAAVLRAYRFLHPPTMH